MDPVTLREASRRIGRPEHYFTIRKNRWKGRLVRFPSPIAHEDGYAKYDFDQVINWWDQVQELRASKAS